MRIRAAATAIGTMLLLALAGCTTPDARPTPTPTPVFSSEAEAFAAAEETYRAYVAAVNARREDPTADDSQRFLIGRALEADIDSQRLLEQSNVKIVGPNVLSTFEGLSTSTDFTEAVAAICIDATMSRVVDGLGADVTPTDRDSMVALDVTFALLNESFVISDSIVSQKRTC